MVSDELEINDDDLCGEEAFEVYTSILDNNSQDEEENFKKIVDKIVSVARKYCISYDDVGKTAYYYKYRFFDSDDIYSPSSLYSQAYDKYLDSTEKYNELLEKSAKYRDYVEKESFKTTKIGRLLECRNEEEILEIFKKYYFKESDLRISRDSQAFDEFEERKEVITKVFNEKYLPYVEQREAKWREEQEIKKEKDMVNNAGLWIKKFIDAKDLSIKSFCKKYDIEEESLHQHVDTIRAHDPELYEQYIAFINQKRDQLFTYLVTNLKKMVKEMKNGITENEKTRPFEVEDYFMHTKWSFDEMLTFSHNVLTEEESRVLKTFVNKNKDKLNHKINAPKILAEKHIINGREVTEAEKKAVMKYLFDNNIPYQILYSKLIKKQCNNELKIEEPSNITNENGSQK